MSFDQRIEKLVASILERAVVKKTFLKNLKKPPLKFCLNILEDIDRMLNGCLPAGQTKNLAGFRQDYGQLTSGEYRVIYKRDPWEILFLFHKNEQKRRFKHL